MPSMSGSTTNSYDAKLRIIAVFDILKPNRSYLTAFLQNMGDNLIAITHTY